MKTELTTEKEYYVWLGGSPPDSAEVYTTADEAEAAAIRMARDVAVNGDDDPNTIGIWGGECDEGGWGACPEGDPGGYYPQIRVAR